MCVYSADAKASEDFYAPILGGVKAPDPMNGTRYYFSSNQFLEVANMEQAVTMLYREQRLSPRHHGPQMGLDGKWQANFYDPDGTRVELMEFQPVSKPCCSPFTAASPVK